MLMPVVLVCALIWLPILVYQITRRGFFVLLLWLLVAPVATNVVQGHSNPFFRTERAQGDYSTWDARDVLKSPSTITLQDLLEPTRTLFMVFLGTYLLNALLTAKRLVPLDRTEIWMGVFSLVLIASVFLQSGRLALSLHVAGDAFIASFVAYYLSRRLVTSERRFYQLSQVLVCVGFYIILIGVIERLTHSELYYRLGGPFYSDIALHVVMGIVFLIILSDSLHRKTFLYEKQAFFRGIRWVGLYFAPVMIFLTWARTNWLALLMAVAVFLLLGHRLIKPLRKAGTIGLVLILAMILVISIQATGLKEIIEQRASNVGNVYTRMAAWQILIQESLKRPIFGSGLQNSRYILIEKTARFRGILNEATAHNSFLAILFELGIVGLFAYLAIMGSIIRMGLRLYRHGTYPRDRWRGVAVIAIIVSYLVPALFANALYLAKLNHIYLYVFVGGIAGLYGRRPV